MEKAEELDMEIDDIGTMLKSNRLKNKKSLEEISSELCIRKIYLTALEEGDYETLEPIPYGVGYMRTYARYLGLNPDRAVKLYKAASQIEELPQVEEENIPEVNKSSWFHIISGVIAVILIYAIWNGYSTTSEKDIIKTENEMTEITAEESPLSDEIVKTEEIVEMTENPETSNPVGIENTELKVENVEKKTLENTKVNIEFLGESWVELKDKNKVYFQGVFHKGDKKEIEYVDNLFLSVGRPRNVKLSVKGQEKNILQRKRKMNIPLDSLD